MSATAPPSVETEGGVSRASLGWFEQMRRDAPWWVYPVTVVVALVLFSLYAAWTSIVAHPSVYGPYLSPFYSPQIWVTGPVSPAIWVVWAPLIFRASCYYYRKSYHRSFFWDPPACARPESRTGKYRGETRFPFVLSNLHRFTMYITTVVLAFLWYDVARALIYNGHWYLGLGTGIMLINVILLTGYTSGCHSLRHLVGGGLDCYSCSAYRRARKRTWNVMTWFNLRHSVWAWASMISVVSVDVYIRLLMSGLPDPHILLG